MILTHNEASEINIDAIFSTSQDAAEVMTLQHGGWAVTRKAPKLNAH